MTRPFECVLEGLFDTYPPFPPSSTYVMLHAMTKKTTRTAASKKSEGTTSRGGNGGATRGRGGNAGGTAEGGSERTGKVAKTQLVEQVAEKTGLTKKQSEEAVSAMLDAVVSSIKGGQSVGLPGLGTLSVKDTAARTGVRPGTSEKIQIPAGKKVAFKVASTLKGTL